MRTMKRMAAITMLAVVATLGAQTAKADGVLVSERNGVLVSEKGGVILSDKISSPSWDIVIDVMRTLGGIVISS